MRHAVLAEKHTLCMSVTGLPGHRPPAASDLTDSWPRDLQPAPQDHHWRHHHGSCPQAGRGSTGRPQLQCSMAWSCRPCMGCCQRCSSVAAHCQDYHSCHLCHQAATGSAALPQLHFSTGCSMTWSGWPPAGCPHRCRSPPAHLLGLCSRWASLGRPAAPRLRWVQPVTGTKAVWAGPWQQSRRGMEPSLPLALRQACSHHSSPPQRRRPWPAPWVSLAAGCRLGACTRTQFLGTLLAARSQQAGVCHRQRRAQGLCHRPHPAGQALQVKHTRIQDGRRRLLH